MEHNLMQNLNKEQLEAVTHKNGPLLIVAGAGTGKTTVITQKIAYAIEQGWVKSDEILALTFTDKAAGEMEERVDRLLPIGYLDLWISTFHSFAERILKAHGLAIGLPNDFKLLNEFEQWILIRKNFDRFSLKYYRPAGNPTKFIQALIKHFSRLKDEDISPSAYLEYAEELKQNLDAMMSGGKGKKKKTVIPAKVGIQKRHSGKEKNLDPRFRGDDKRESGDDKRESGDDNLEIAEQEVERINELASAYHVYQRLLLENEAMDFGDLINCCLKLFRERPAVLKRYRQQFKYILVDEFQDTNWAQYELVKILMGERQNLIAVADDDQAIYRFRGASMSNILQFKKDFPDSKEIVLIKNYRNTQNILDLSYEFIKLNNPNRLEWRLESQKSEVRSKKLNKKLIAQNKGKGEIKVIQGRDLGDEVNQVVRKIIDLKNKDKEASWNDFAILVRANDSAKEFTNTLEAANLPYQFLASRGLYAKPVIIDIISYLKLLDDYHESRAMYRVLSLPVFNFSYRELVNFNYWASKKSWSLYEVLKSASSFNFPEEINSKINRLLALISRHTALVKDKSASEIIITFLNDSGYLKYLSGQAPLDLNDDNEINAGSKPKNLTGQAEARSREIISYLNQFLKRVKSFETAAAEPSVKRFLEELELEIKSGEEGSLAFDPETGPEAIKVMTVHAAKGLEFKYVFAVSLVDLRFPTIARNEAISIPDALIKEILPQGDIHLEEERRLFYVAMTRARRGLYFSWATDYGGTRKKKPSRFLVECGLIDGKSEVAGNETEFRGHLETWFQKLKVSPPVETRHGASLRTQKTSISNDTFKQTDFQPPVYFSYTQLAAFGNCPYQYRFAHVLRVPLRGKSVFSFGKTMHVTLAKLFELINEKKGLGQNSLFDVMEQSQAPAPSHLLPARQSLTLKAFTGGLISPSGRGRGKMRRKNPKIALEEILFLYEKSWIDDWYESKRQKEENRQRGKEILKIFYEKHKDGWPETIYTEKGFKMKLKNQGEYYTVRGVIDRVDKIGDRIKIVDYKTGQPKEKLSFEEKEQLLIYQLAAGDLFRQEVGALAFYYLDNNQEIEFIGRPDELNKVKAKIIETISEIKKGIFPPKPSRLCRHCDYFDICEFRQT